jgi:hypothetical protein
VQNVAPSVNLNIVTNNVDEGDDATITATFTDPGVNDTHTATIDWDEGSPLQAVNTGQLAAGISHIYGDNAVYDVVATVTDDDGGSGNDTAPLTILNVAPTVDAMATVNGISEGQTATVSATFTDPGFLDTHTATVDWDDGNGAQVADLQDLAAGIDQEYGDNGNYNVTVTITDDDGGSGDDTVVVAVANLDPDVIIDLSGAISFPGGDYLVVKLGEALALTATGSDAGSDDLTFDWNIGDINTHFNNGFSADLPKSPGPIYPFQADDAIEALYGAPGVSLLGITVSDDDNGSANAVTNVIITGNADDTQGLGWWKHQYASSENAFIDTPTAEGYRDIVNAVSSIFSETTIVVDFESLHTVLSPTGQDRHAFARSKLMVAWLQFASGAVTWDTLVDGTIYLDLMFAAEAIINNPAASPAQLRKIEQRLAKVRHAE